MNTTVDQIESILAAAVAIDAEAERRRYLDDACAGDAELRGRLDELVANHFRAGDFLEKPAAEFKTSVNERMNERSGTVIGPYKLLEQIGEGGFGLVFMAEQQHPVRRRVAVKVLKPGMDTRQVIARFEAERQALALMDHVNIAKVLEAGETESGRPYFAMELVRGMPITDYCDKNNLAPGQRLELFVTVCQAVQHAHQKGIIHRDIKPSNVMVTLHDGVPVVKVIDFGIAKALGQQLTDKTLYTAFAQLVGTPLYMSPEQAEMSGLDVDTRSDIYSLGVLLYELLTGTTPFDKERLTQAGYDEMRRIIREEEPARPSQRLSTLDKLASVSAKRRSDPKRLRQLVEGELDWIVMKSLEKERGRRYETASAFAGDVERYLHDESVAACPPSAWYRARKFARRHRGGLAIATLALTGLLLVVAVVAGAAGWAASDRAARELALDRQVDMILDEAAGRLESARWPEAVTAVERVDRLLAAAGRSERPPRHGQLERDLAMARRLEDLYNQPGNEMAVAGFSGGVMLGSYQADDRAYAKACADYGIDLAALPVAEAAERVRLSSIRLELLRALDEWADLRRRAGVREQPDWQQLLEVAKLVDPDDARNQLRTALQRDDRKALQALAASADVRRLPASTLGLLGRALGDYLEAPDQAVALLRQAQRQYPADLWINGALGWYCFRALRPPRLDEAARSFAVAVALRPDSVVLRNCLGRALLASGAFAEASAEFSKVIEMRPTYPAPWFNRGVADAHLKKWESALASGREGIRLAPNHPDAHFGLGEVFRLQGNFAQAEVEYEKAIRLQPDYTPYHNSFKEVRRLQGKAPQEETIYGELAGLDIHKPEDTVGMPSVPPPAGALVLFDGSGLDNWASVSGGPAPWRLQPGGIMEVDGASIVTKRKFSGAFKLHVEFRVPYLPLARGQARGNSGVYVQGRYEVQVLDSYGLKTSVRDCGAVFDIAAPRVNACKAPTVWQSYDIEFQSPTRANGKKTAPALITVYHNGVKVHDNLKIVEDNTRGSLGGDPCAPGPIMLQGHNDPVQYRNIWLMPRPEIQEK
jgi:serine/threonine protein kinase/tetratricopeptide (TPR) repeat protein